MGFLSFACAVLLVLNSYGTVANQPPTRKMVAVEGVVYCKLCVRDPNNGFHIVSTLSPLAGAEVKLQCNNTMKGFSEQMKTGDNGEFLMKPTKVSTWGVHKCKLFLVSSSRTNCILPTRGDGPWNLGFPLTAANTTATANLQYFVAAQPLLFYYYWPDCS